MDANRCRIEHITRIGPYVYLVETDHEVMLYKDAKGELRLEPDQYAVPTDELRTLSEVSIYSVSDLGMAYDKLFVETKDKDKALALLRMAMDIAASTNVTPYRAAKFLVELVRA